MNSPFRSHRPARHITPVCRAGALLLLLAGAWAALGTAPALAAVPAGSAAATAPEEPSVMITPTDTTPTDPNGGQWFYFSLKPGQSTASLARITNPAPVAQTVTLGITDLLFTANGTPYLNAGAQTDVGSWSHFDQGSVTVPARSSVEVPFQVTAPDNAEPGDHFGVVEARSAPEALPGSRALQVVKTVAVRLYITVPGLATRSFAIGGITSRLDSWVMPHFATVTAVIKNTGRIRLSPHVSIGGVPAVGSPLLLAQSSEAYTARVPVAFYGGPVNETVSVTTNYPGLARRVPHTQFVFPFALLAALLLVGLVAFGLYLLVRSRLRKARRLRADLRRLEQLVLSRPGVGPAGPAPGQRSPAGADGAGPGAGPATVAAMEAAIKRARRTGHLETLPDLAVALHEAGGDALDALLESVPLANGRAPELMSLVAGYPAERVQASPRLAGLSEPDRARLGSKGAGAVGEFGAGPRGSAKRPRQPVS